MGARAELVFATPRKLPKPEELSGRVAVLDIAFASSVGHVSFEKTTAPFITGLGERLAAWVDHHDHERHADYQDDARFMLATKREHGACPEMITEEVVHRAGRVDTICCHNDFDGLFSAAKWLRGGTEPYPGADADAHAIDTCLGRPSARGKVLDAALRAHPRDDSLKGLIVRFLTEGATDAGLWALVSAKAHDFDAIRRSTEKLAGDYAVIGDVAFVGVPAKQRIDKTELLLLGQERATLACIVDASSVTLAARFDSGINLLTLLGLEGGMPTRASVPTKRLPEVLKALNLSASERAIAATHLGA